MSQPTNRREFVKSAAAIGTGLLAASAPALAQSRLNKGDAAILRFLAAVELIESDLWIQYNELGGVQDREVPGHTGGNEEYTKALANLDGDMPQYIHDNTEDEISHAAFVNAYLLARGADPLNLDSFRVLQGSKATGAAQVGRLTNLMQLKVDTSWWTRYRSRNNNPDLDPTFAFPQAVPSLFAGQFPAIPRNNDDLTPAAHIQAIANTAGFHFGFIEEGGTSVYPGLAQRVTDLEVLRVLLSIGPTETAHFQTWHDKAGNAPALTDPKNPALVFPDLNAKPFGGEDFQTNLIMPEPCPFLSRSLPSVSIIRPTATRGAAMATARSFIDDGLFIGQIPAFLELLTDLASAADAATRGGD